MWVFNFFSSAHTYHAYYFLNICYKLLVFTSYICLELILHFFSYFHLFIVVFFISPYVSWMLKQSFDACVPRFGWTHQWEVWRYSYSIYSLNIDYEIIINSYKSYKIIYFYQIKLTKIDFSTKPISFIINLYFILLFFCLVCPGFFSYSFIYPYSGSYTRVWS